MLQHNTLLPAEDHLISFGRSQPRISVIRSSVENKQRNYLSSKVSVPQSLRRSELVLFPFKKSSSSFFLRVAFGSLLRSVSRILPCVFKNVNAPVFLSTRIWAYPAVISTREGFSRTVHLRSPAAVTAAFGNSRHCPLAKQIRNRSTARGVIRKVP